MQPRPEVQHVALTIEYGAPNFRWQMAFNAFSIEKVSNGSLLRFAYVVGNTAAEIVPILINDEGVTQFGEASTSYIEEFGQVPSYAGPALPSVRTFSPLFSNHLRASRSGSSGEFAFYTVPLKDVAQAAKGQMAASIKVSCVQVALLHSDVALHQQVVLALLASGK